MNIKEAIENKIASVFRTDENFITSERKTRVYCDARKMYCHVLYCHDTYTMIQIAEILGYKDHSTIIHNLKSFNGLYQTNELFREKADGVINFYKTLIKYENQGKDLQHTPIEEQHMVADSNATNY